MQQLRIECNGQTIVSNYYAAEQNKGGISFVLLSATGTQQRLYRRFSEYFSARGVDVYTFDYVGIGDSLNTSVKESKSSIRDWAMNNVGGVLEYVKKQHPDNKLIVFGQSVGGQIIGLSPQSLDVDGLVFIACQSGYWGLWPFPKNLLLYLNWWSLFIITKLFGYFPGKKMGIMEDLPKQVALEWANWGRAKNYLFDFYPETVQYHDKLTIPLLAYSFSDDNSAPLKAVEWLNAKYSNCTITHKHISPKEIGVKSIGHFGFFRPKCEVLWKDMFEIVKAW